MGKYVGTLAGTILELQLALSLAQFEMLKGKKQKENNVFSTF